MPSHAPLSHSSLSAARAHRAAVAGRTLLRSIPRVVAGSLVVALAARVAFYLPGVPVPVTAQTLAVLLVGAALGAHAGAASLGLYWLQALAGLPVCAAGTGGPVVVCGPSGGYLLGFVAAAWIAGRALDTGWAATRARQALALLGATCAIFLPGMLWQATLVGPHVAFSAGLVPFLGGEAVKLLLALALLPAARRCRRA